MSRTTRLWSFLPSLWLYLPSLWSFLRSLWLYLPSLWTDLPVIVLGASIRMHSSICMLYICVVADTLFWCVTFMVRHLVIPPSISKCRAGSCWTMIGFGVCEASTCRSANTTRCLCHLFIMSFICWDIICTTRRSWRSARYVGVANSFIALRVSWASWHSVRVVESDPCRYGTGKSRSVISSTSQRYNHWALRRDSSVCHYTTGFLVLKI